MSGEPAASTALGRLLELLALCGFAVAQPLLASFGASPGTFIFRDATPADVVLFAALLVLVPPLVLWSIEALLGLISPRVRSATHLALVAGMVGVIAIQAVKQVTGLRGAIVLVLAVGAAIAAVMAYSRWDPVRLFLRISALAPVLFVALFLASSSISPLLGTSGQVAGRADSARHSPSVVVLLFDEWPTTSIVDANGTIDAGLYPNLAAFASGSTWYRNATSISNSTRYAVPAILTGRVQRGDLLPVASSQPKNLFSLFAPTHRIEANESVTGLCPRETCHGHTVNGDAGLAGLMSDAAKAFGERVSPWDSTTDVSTEFVEDTSARVTKKNFAALASRQQVLANAIVNRPNRFVKFLDSFHAHETPTVHFLHLLLPHVPLRFLPSGLQYPAPAPEIGRQGDTWTDGEWPVALTHQRAILQTMYLDRLVGQLLARLRATHLLGRSVVAITADHGIAYQPGAPSRALSDVALPQSLYPELLWAPLIVKAPGQVRPAVSDTNVMSIDVLPTVASLANVSLRWHVDGVVAGTRHHDTKLFQRAYSDSVGGRLEAAQRFDGRTGFASMLAQNVSTVIDTGDRRWQAWRVRPYGSIVGRSLEEMTHGAVSPIRATLTERDALRRVAIGTGSIPAMVWGTADRAATLAIVVNGTVAGVSPTFTSITPLRFASMIPERLLHNGANRVELYELTGPDAQPVFHLIADGTG